jgi:hypothetical protein
MMKKTIQEAQEKTITTIESYFPKKNNKRSFDAKGKINSNHVYLVQI